MRHKYLLALTLCAGTVAPATAQKATSIDVPANASWKHAATGVILRPKIAGFPRGTIADSSSSELDVMIQYAEGGPTAVTLYIFRPSLMSVPVWFDRSEAQILLRSEVYGSVTPAGPARAFAVPHAAATSALQRVYVPGLGDYKSTGLVMVPLGEWLVAVRASSKELDPAALEARLGEIVAGIVWPDKVAESLAAVPVAACADTLPYDRKAKAKKPDMTQALLGAVMFAAAEDKSKDKKDGEVEADPPKPSVWCREGESAREYGVYRTGDGYKGYVLAVGDAGITVSVGPAFPLEKEDPGFTLSVGMLDRNLVYPNFDRLPAPKVAFDAINRLSPVSSTTRGSKNITIGM